MPNLSQAFGREVVRRPKQAEKEVQADIFQWVNIVLTGAWVVRQNTGSTIIPATVDEKTGQVRKERRVKYGQPGQYDLGGLIKVYTPHYPKPLGIALQIEVKAEGVKPGQTQHDTDQATWGAEFNDRGGIAFWANSLDMCIAKMRDAFIAHGFPWDKRWEISK